MFGIFAFLLTTFFKVFVTSDNQPRHVCLSVSMKQRDSHRRRFDAISNLGFLLTFVDIRYDIKTNKCTYVYESVSYTLYTSYIFRPLMWPSSGRCITKNTYIEILQTLMEPTHIYKILNFKKNIHFLKFNILFQN
jgi:hypothetical protein